MIVVLEDSRVSGQLLKNELESLDFGGSPIVVHPNLMTAVADMRKAKGVIIDWILDDNVDALESGVLEFLAKRGVPHVIFTGSPDRVPEGVNCPVIDKDDIDKLTSVVREWA